MGRQRQVHVLNSFYGTDGGLSRKVQEIRKSKGLTNFYEWIRND
jgi:hypothetical protein